MLINLGKKFLALSLFSCSIAFCAEQPLQFEDDTRHITKSWPPALVQKIQEYQPPHELRQKIDQLLLTEDNVRLLIALRDGRLDSARQEARRNAQAVGFGFLNAYKDHIFTFAKIPGYVFKISEAYEAKKGKAGSELMNFSRVEEADRLRRLAKKDHRDHKVIIPIKHACVLPKYASIEYANQPKILVVAQKIDLPESLIDDDASHRANFVWLMQQRASDMGQPSNRLSLPEGKTALIDTEAWENQGCFTLSFRNKKIRGRRFEYTRLIRNNGTVERSMRSSL